MYNEMAKYVDMTYERLDYEKQVRFITQMFRKHRLKPALIYDVACGSGRHSKLLRDRGYEVEGIDLNQGMLSLARERVPDIRLHRQDMRFLNMKKKADCIMTMFSAINHLNNHAELKKTLRSFHKNLNKGGLVIMDTMHTSNNWSDEYANARFLKFENTIIGEFDRSFKISKNKGFVNQIYIIWEGKSKVAKIFDNKYENALYDVPKIKKMARDVGFTVKTYFNFSTRAKYKRPSTYVFVLQKR